MWYAESRAFTLWTGELLLNHEATEDSFILETLLSVWNRGSHRSDLLRTCLGSCLDSKGVKSENHLFKGSKTPLNPRDVVFLWLHFDLHNFSWTTFDSAQLHLRVPQSLIFFFFTGNFCINVSLHFLPVRDPQVLIDSVWIPDPRRTRSTRNCNLKIPTGAAEPFWPCAVEDWGRSLCVCVYYVALSAPSARRAEIYLCWGLFFWLTSACASAVFALCQPADQTSHH